MDSACTNKTVTTLPVQASSPNAKLIEEDNILAEVHANSAPCFIEGFFHGGDSAYSFYHIPSTVRNSDNEGTFCHGPSLDNDTTVEKDADIVKDTMVARICGEYAGKEQKTNMFSRAASFIGTAEVTLPSATESKESLSGTHSSTVKTCIFTKDEQKSAVMQPPSPDNHLSGNGKTLNPSYGALSTQQFGFIEDDSVRTPNPKKQQMFLENARAVVDYTQANIWCPIPKNCEDSFSLPYLVSEAVLRSGMLGYGQHSPHNLGICTSDHPGLIPTLSSESENWCQSTGLSEDQQMETGYQPPSGIHNAYMMHGSSDMHSPFIGFLSQKVCLICGDEASGCHYGVITCGSCKVFYKRAVEGHHNYLCAGRNDCIVDKIRRKNCPACRLRKCYQAGMILGGRKLRKLNNLKAMGVIPALAVHSPQGQSYDCQALVSFPCMPMVRELQFTPQIISILENIEPETVYSGYDSTQPETPSLLLNSLNRLCERQLLWIVKWSKSLPGFRSLHINDQMTLIQYSWMNLMVFSLGWRSYQNVTREYLYFAPDLILSEERMRRSPISDLCLAMQVIPQEFANLQVTKKEFLCMKALILLNTVPLEGLKSQAQFDEMRYSYIRELTKATQLQEKGMVASSQRFYNLTKLMDAMHEIVRKVNLYCLSTFIQAEALQVEFPQMMSEVITSQLPKVLAGMVKPLLFHKK